MLSFKFLCLGRQWYHELSEVKNKNWSRFGGAELFSVLIKFSLKHHGNIQEKLSGVCLKLTAKVRARDINQEIVNR